MISSGLAKQIEEYVPIARPIVKVIANNLVLTGPKMIKEIKAKMVVRDVINDRG